jgi:cell division protein FtsB
MGITDRLWAALTSMIKLEDKVAQQSAALMSQQTKIENLTERVIRIEAQLEFLTGAAMVKKLSRGKGPDLLP